MTLSWNGLQFKIPLLAKESILEEKFNGTCLLLGHGRLDYETDLDHTKCTFLDMYEYNKPDIIMNFQDDRLPVEHHNKYDVVIPIHSDYMFRDVPSTTRSTFDTYVGEQNYSVNAVKNAYDALKPGGILIIRNIYVLPSLCWAYLIDKFIDDMTSFGFIFKGTIIIPKKYKLHFSDRPKLIFSKPIDIVE